MASCSAVAGWRESIAGLSIEVISTFTEAAE